MTYKITKYWDTYPEKVIISSIKTLEEAKIACEKARRENKNPKFDFYIFDSDGNKKN